MGSPYQQRPARSFWRTSVSEPQPFAGYQYYRPKFQIRADDRIATAGSCFAQHVTRRMRDGGFSVLDQEPAPPMLSAQEAKQSGYGVYSARYGNIYSVRQLLQLAQDAWSGTVDRRNVWVKDGQFHDALRPGMAPVASPDEVLSQRRDHLARVKQLFTMMDIFIFTFGLTETWVDRETGRAYPTAPGVIAGEYDPTQHVLRNFGCAEVFQDFQAFYDFVGCNRPELRIILSVSPVPLIATASDDHVVVASSYSKSVLRAVAGELAARHANIDYFPAYEIVSNPWSSERYYEPDRRSVSEAGVDAVMRVFFDAHPPPHWPGGDLDGGDDEVSCEDILLEALSK